MQGYSQTDLAVLIGVTLQRYSAWERATATLNKIQFYARLCRQLDVTMDWLFFGDVRALPADMRERLEALLRTVEAP